MQSEKHFLGHIFSQRRITQHGARRPKNGAVMERKCFVKTGGSPRGRDLVWRGVNQGSCLFAHYFQYEEHRPERFCGKFRVYDANLRLTSAATANVFQDRITTSLDAISLAELTSQTSARHPVSSRENHGKGSVPLLSPVLNIARSQQNFKGSRTARRGQSLRRIELTLCVESLD